MNDPSPSQIGRYRILKTLGEGAMARVYLAELATLGDFRRKVALKIVHPEFARDKKFLQLMGREAMIGSRLQHPNIVETLEFSEADGLSFLALEYVEGQTLEQLLDRIRDEGRDGLPVDFCLELILPVLEGLAYAHVLPGPSGEPMGIIHRDLKPANIMVSRYGVVKIMDFGIAKAKGVTTNLTTVGQVRGTPLYMSPEQVTGQELDGRSDQFSAATVLHELLTGARAFGGTNLIDIMQRVARGDAGDSIDRLTALHARLPEIIGRMWSVDPAGRYPDCGAAAAEIEELLLDVRHGTPASVDETTVSEGKATGRARKKKRGKKSAGGILGLMALLRGPARKPRKRVDPSRKRRKRKKRKLGPTVADTALVPEPEVGATPPQAAEPRIPTRADSNGGAPAGASSTPAPEPALPPRPATNSGADDGSPDPSDPMEGRTISLIFMEEIFDDVEGSPETDDWTEEAAGDPPGGPQTPNRLIDEITTQLGTPVVTETLENLSQSVEVAPARDGPGSDKDKASGEIDDFFFGDFDDES